MKNFFKNNWMVIVIFIFLISIKFYFLQLTSAGNNYSKDVVYNNGDAGHYYTIAENIFKFHVYSDDNSANPNESATWRAPFWPFLLSLLFYFSKSPLTIIICKSLLEIGLIVLGLYFFKKKSGINNLVLCLFLVLFIEPQYLKYSVTFLSESLTAVLIFLLAIFFIFQNDKKRYSILIPILSAIIVLCHPVSFFFVITLFGIYLLLLLKSNFKVVLIHGLFFFLLVFSWPLRNFKTFNERFYLTASQGATFSKGWNEKVISNFNNVDGDLADESINLKYLNPSNSKQNNTVLENSKLYKEATFKFIETLTFSQKLQIAFKKVKSNFIPYPEKPKSVFIEHIAILFRILYLFVFVQMTYRLVKGQINFNSQKGRALLVVFSIFIGQIVMSIYIYTGLRFNAIYGLTMLFAFLYLNSNFILDAIPFIKTKKIFNS